MRPPPEHAGRTLLEAEDRFAVLASRCEERDDHIAVRYAPAPGVSGGNHFRSIVLPAGSSPEDWVHERLDEAGEWGWRQCRFELDDRTYPANLGDVLGAHDFLPEVYAGYVAHTADVPPARHFMLVRGVSMRDPEDALVIDSLLASRNREARVPLAHATGKLAFDHARLTNRDVVVLLAQLDERPSGFIAYLPHGDCAFVRKLFVAEHARSRGVATALLHAVAERSAGSLVGLFARTDTRLPEFYRARGFAGVTRRETWVRDADAILEEQVSPLGALDEVEGLEGLADLDLVPGEPSGFSDEELTLPEEDSAG